MNKLPLLALAALVSSGVLAQQPKANTYHFPPTSRPCEMPNSAASYLLSRKDVQTELKLTPDVAGKIDSICGKLKADVAAELAAIKEGKKVTEPVTRLYGAANEAFKGLLDQTQGTRLRQLFLRQRGVEAYLYADVQQELGMQPAQTSQLMTLVTNWNDKVRSLNAELKEGKLTKEQRDTQVKDGSRDFMKSIAAVPTEAQKKQLQVIEGPVFHYTKA